MGRGEDLFFKFQRGGEWSKLILDYLGRFTLWIVERGGEWRKLILDYLHLNLYGREGGNED